MIKATLGVSNALNWTQHRQAHPTYLPPPSTELLLDDFSNFTSVEADPEELPRLPSIHLGICRSCAGVDVSSARVAPMLLIEGSSRCGVFGCSERPAILLPLSPTGVAQSAYSVWKLPSTSSNKHQWLYIHTNSATSAAQSAYSETCLVPVQINNTNYTYTQTLLLAWHSLHTVSESCLVPVQINNTNYTYKQTLLLAWHSLHTVKAAQYEFK